MRAATKSAPSRCSLVFSAASRAANNLSHAFDLPATAAPDRRGVALEHMFAFGLRCSIEPSAWLRVGPELLRGPSTFLICCPGFAESQRLFVDRDGNGDLARVLSRPFICSLTYYHLNSRTSPHQAVIATPLLPRLIHLSWLPRFPTGSGTGLPAPSAFGALNARRGKKRRFSAEV